MISAEQQAGWWQKLLTQAGPAQAINDDCFESARTEARDAVSSLPPLNRKQEAWRYSRIDNLFEQTFQSVKYEPGAAQAIDINQWLIADFDSYRLVLLNGHYAAQLSSNHLPAGVRFGSLQQMLEQDEALLTERFGPLAQHTEHQLTALNTALFEDGVVVYIASDVELEKPLEVIYLNTQEATDSGALIHSRNLIALGNNAKATLVERFISNGEAKYFHNNLADINLAAGATLTHYRLQDESRQAYHLSSLYLSQHTQSKYYATGLAFGAGWARTDLTVKLQQQHAECYLNGLYTAGEKQLNAFHLDVQHIAPHCISREQFKGILYGKGRAVFDGHILVAEQAQKSDAALTNDNLMLSRDAEVDTRPQLEIYADDVKCSHGTTVGQLDEQQIFYLRSRGISESAARRMLCIGFASEIIDTINNEALHNYAAEKLLLTLNEAVAVSANT